MSYHSLLPVTVLLAVFAAVGCNEEAPSADAGSRVDSGMVVDTSTQPQPGPYDEVFAQGITRYVDSPVTLETLMMLPGAPRETMCLAHRRLSCSAPARLISKVFW